ncbi:MAG: hypothetical protein HYT87_01505 [Nitrospirae bacterium]|nr:hypothetical protein [Nitrospirota bacterium]
MKHRRLAYSLALSSLLVGWACLGVMQMRERTRSYGYSVNLLAGREGEKPQVQLRISTSAGRGFWTTGAQVVWNGQSYKSPAGSNVPLDSGRVTTLEDLRIELPPLQVGTTQLEMTNLSVYSHDGRALKFPGSVSVHSRAVPRDSDFLLEFLTASHEIQVDDTQLTSCRELVDAEDLWTDEQWTRAMVQLRRQSRAIEAVHRALQILPARSAMELDNPVLAEALLKARDLGCFLLLLGSGEQKSGEPEAAVRTYFDTARLGLHVALSSHTVEGLILAGSLAAQAFTVLGSSVAAGSLDADRLLEIESEAARLLAGWMEGVPSLVQIQARESRQMISPVAWYYSPAGPVQRLLMEAMTDLPHAMLRERIDRVPMRIRIVETAAASCRQYRENGSLPAREGLPGGITIEPLSGTEWMVTVSAPAGAERSKDFCWKETDSCSGRLGLRVRCGSG